MRADRFWVLLVLAAVFAMHGLQCMAAHTGHMETASVHGQAAASLTAAGPVLPAVVVPDPHPDGLVGMAGVASVHAGQESPAPDVAHVWAACLAVLATGLTVLGAWWVLRRGTTSSGGGGEFHRPRPRPAWARVLRPPDLATLCLLRI